ncbi:MAG: GH92 family glycosyl hydrolase [Saprospiraceae bacterium]
MRKIFIAISLLGLTDPIQAQHHLEVNPFIGTGGHGHTFPGAVMPFGMVQLSPDTRTEGWDACSGYHYSDTTLLGFSHTHLSGTGVGDYCDILVTPRAVTNIDFSKTENLITPIHFKKSEEKAHAGFYQVRLDQENIIARLTATDRTGVHEYQFDRADTKVIVINLRHRDKVLKAFVHQSGPNEINGCRISKGWAKEQHVYFAMAFSQKISKVSYSEDSLIMTLFFEKQKAKKITLQCAVSPVDILGAENNLYREWVSFDFKKAQKNCEERWDKMLSRIEYTAAPDRQEKYTKIFYTALYHSLIHPSLSQDADGRYRGLDQKIYQAEGPNKRYTVFSLWDTYRAAHPLYQLAYPEYNLQFAKTFLQHYKEVNRLPVWELSSCETYCMIGNHAIPVLAMCYLDSTRTPGLKHKDVCEAIEATFNADYSDISFFLNGYIPMNKASESVSKSIENSFDYYAYDLVADRKGSEKYYYRNLFNPNSGFLEPKRSDHFLKSFNPNEVNFNYTEANAWQYLFGAQHDIDWMKKSLEAHEKQIAKTRLNLNSEQAFEKRLDSLFTTRVPMTGRIQPDITGLIGQYAHGNEPSHHVAYLYNYCNRTDKTQKIVKKIMNEFYSDQPDGLCGNEDCGQMSAWYVLSALGIYPVDPVSGKFTLGLPAFQKASIAVPGNKIINLSCKHDASDGCVKELMINGNKCTADFYLRPGDQIQFLLGKNGSTIWSNKPVVPKKYTLLPTIKTEEEIFEDSTYLSFLQSGENRIEFSFDTASEVKIYSVPVVIHENVKIFYRNKNALAKSMEQWRSIEFKKKPNQLSYIVQQQYDNQYPAGGKIALADGLTGSNDFRDGFWQGYWNTDIVIDINRYNDTSSLGLSVGMIQDQGSWILFPSRLELYSTQDGKNYILRETIENSEPQDTPNGMRKTFRFSKVPEMQFRIKIINPGKLPEWHLSAGNPSWMFVDEIKLE